MKLSQISAAVVFAGLANAQSQCLSLVPDIPACALGYIAEIAYSSYTCDIIDFGCQCSHLNDLLAPVANSLSTFGNSCGAGAVYQPAVDLCSCHTSYSDSSITLEPYQSACEASAVAIPGCALGYLADAGASQGCQINDFGCQCKNFDAIDGAISDEVSSFCAASGVALSEVMTSASSLCACVSASSPGGGGGPTVNPTTTTAPGSPSPTGTSSPASPTNSVSSGPSATSSPSGPKGSSSGKGSSGPSGSPSNKVSSGPSPSSQPKTTAHSGSMSVPVFTGAGVTASAFGGLFGVVVGLAALL